MGRKEIERSGMKPLIKVLLIPLFLLCLPFTANTPKQNSEHETRLYWLTMNIYYEAGNQSTLGKIAVALVTINRASHIKYEGTIESVVKQHRQFSWYHKKKRYAPQIMSAEWKESRRIAEYALKLSPEDDMMKLFAGVTHFHASYVKPKWGRHPHFERVVQIGDHIFYKMKG